MTPTRKLTAALMRLGPAVLPFAAVASYVNHRFLKLPATIGLMAWVLSPVIVGVLLLRSCPRALASAGRAGARCPSTAAA